MTHIEIPLVLGDNYISFRATSINTINEILTTSGIKGDILKFIKWDPIQQKEIPIAVDGTEYIQEGRGYYLFVSSPGIISYEGTEYSLTFDQFTSRIVKEWNLLGTGKDMIVTQSWCKIMDPVTLLPVTILQPDHSYWVNYDECMKTSIGSSALTALAAVGTVLFAYYMLNKFGYIGKRID